MFAPLSVLWELPFVGGKGKASCVISIDLRELMLQARCIHAYICDLCVRANVLFSSACRCLVTSVGRGDPHKKKKRGSRAVRQVVRREWTLLHVDPDNKAVSVMQQVSSAVIIREAGHTHTSAEGSRAVGGTEHGSVKLHVILMAIMSANESTPVNFTARSISDQLTWLSSAAAVLLTGDCVQWLMFTAWQHLTPRHPAQFSKYMRVGFRFEVQLDTEFSSWRCSNTLNQSSCIVFLNDLCFRVGCPVPLDCCSVWECCPHVSLFGNAAPQERSNTQMISSHISNISPCPRPHPPPGCIL